MIWIIDLQNAKCKMHTIRNVETEAEEEIMLQSACSISSGTLWV